MILVSNVISSTLNIFFLNLETLHNYDCCSRERIFLKAKQTRHIGRPHPGGGVKSAGIALGEKQIVVRYHAVGRRPVKPEDGFSHLSLHDFRRLSLTRAMLVIIC